MGRINWKRVVLGGLVAGLISLASGWALGHLVLREEVEAVLRRLNVEMGLAAFLRVLAMRLGFGIGLVWLYAAIRPRFGPGPRTAVIAATAMWLFVWVFYTAALSMFQFYSVRAMLLALVWNFFEALLAALAGAAIYQEAG